jgi:hypothetical protein
MKGGQSLNHLQQKKQEKEDELWVKPQLCHVCKKLIPGAYGHTTLNAGVVWSCSKSCETEVQQLKQGEKREVPPL